MCLCNEKVLIKLKFKNIFMFYWYIPNYPGGQLLHVTNPSDAREQVLENWFDPLVSGHGQGSQGIPAAGLP